MPAIDWQPGKGPACQWVWAQCVFPLLLRPQASLRSSPCAHWGPSSAWSSRRSSWSSLGRAPSLKHRGQRGERESLLSGDGKGSTDDEAEDGRPGTGSRPGSSPGPQASPLRRAESLDHHSTLDLQSPRPAALLPAKFHDCNGQTVALPSEFFLRIDSHKEDTVELDDDVEDVSGPQQDPQLSLCCFGPIVGQGSRLARGGVQLWGSQLAPCPQGRPSLVVSHCLEPPW